MSIETSLKSLILSLSKNNESPEDAYLVARKNGHNIEKLYLEVEKRAWNRLKLLSKKDRDELIQNVIKIRVSNRYKLISLLNIRSESKSFSKSGFGEYSSLLTVKYIEEIRTIAIKLNKIAKLSLKRNTDANAMNGSNIKRYFERLKEFETNLGKKL